MPHTFVVWRRGWFCLALVWLVAGCGTISSNTVQLSVEVTNRIKDIETSHRAFVNAYFDTEVERVDRFMDKQWTPLFLRNFLGTSGILVDLQQSHAISDATIKELTEAAKMYLDDPSEAERMANDIAVSLNKSRGKDAQVIEGIVNKYVRNERVTAATTHLVSLLQVETPARMIMDFAEAAHLQIEERRESLIAPLEKARKRALDELSAAYQEFYAGQGIITGRLEAAARRSTEEAKLVDSVAGTGSTAKLMDQLEGFAVDFNDSFKKIEGGGGKKPEQIVDSLKKKLDEALTKHGLK